MLSLQRVSEQLCLRDIPQDAITLPVKICACSKITDEEAGARVDNRCLVLHHWCPLLDFLGLGQPISSTS